MSLVTTIMLLHENYPHYLKVFSDDQLATEYLDDLATRFAFNAWSLYTEDEVQEFWEQLEFEIPADGGGRIVVSQKALNEGMSMFEFEHAEQFLEL